MTTEDAQDMQNDECMTMTKDDIKNVINSCRKRLGKSKDIPIVEQKQISQQDSCCEDPACPTSTVTKKGFGK